MSSDIYLFTIKENQVSAGSIDNDIRVRFWSQLTCRIISILLHDEHDNVVTN